MTPFAVASVLHDSRMISALVAAPLIHFGGLALGRWLKQRHNVGFGVMYHWFVVALAIFAPLKTWHIVEYGYDHTKKAEQVVVKVAPAPDPKKETPPPLEPSKETHAPEGSDESWHDAGILYFGSALIILGIIVGLALLRRFLWELYFHKRYKTEAPKLLQQVFGFGVFCTGLLMVLSKRHDWAVDAFLAGSGIVAVVIGFAMQETLANIVSGIALQIGQPFKTGDWLIVTDIRAEVIEVNWRSTRLRTNDDIFLDIPNKTIVTSTITNLNFPTNTHANRIRVGFEYGSPPNVVREVLQRSAEAAPYVVSHPPVRIFLKDFADSSVVYEIKYSCDDEARFNEIEDAIRTNIWYEAKRAGLNMPFPQRVVQITREKAAARSLDELRNLALKLDLLTPLNEAQREHLLANAHVLRFGRGERIIKQGDDGCSMFVVFNGELEVFVRKDERETQIATLRNGDAFGEMCMLTGEVRSATIRAKVDSLVWEIRRAEIQPLLQENAEMASLLSELLARRKMETEGILAAQAPAQIAQEKTKEYANGVLGKIRALFQI